MNRLLYVTLFCLCFTGNLWSQYPKLLIDETRLQEIQAAVDVPGSAHEEMLAVLRADVDANAAFIIGGGDRNGSNWNYNRSFMARKAAMVYAVTGITSYAQLAYDALYAVHNDPDPDLVLPESGKGLRRATVGKGFAVAYDLCYDAWTSAQRDYVRDKISLAITNWTTFSHPNVTSSPFGSNWVAVCRGAELLMILSIHEGGTLPSRVDYLKSWLNQHMANYGNKGWTQEGNYYTAYAGQFLIPAIIALRNAGDNGLDAMAASKNLHQLALYGGMFNASQESTQWSVGSNDFARQGWTSLLFEVVPTAEKPYYKWFYDRHRGLLNPAQPEERYDPLHAGTIFAMMFYPEGLTALDPGQFYPTGIEDDHGGYWIRDRWQDADDLIVSLGADTTTHNNAWDEADALQLNVLANGTKFAGGPSTSRLARLFTQVLVNGNARTSQTSTGKLSFFESGPFGGYAIADGGGKYGSLGVPHAFRHVKVDFRDENGYSLITTFDEMRASNLNTFTWQFNEQGRTFHTGEEDGTKTFIIEGEDGAFLKGWVLHPRNLNIPSNSPIRFDYFDSQADILVAMATGKGSAPTGIVSGSGLASTLTIGNRRVGFNEATGRIYTETVASELPLASFSINTQQGEPPLLVQVDASSSSDPQGQNLTYWWDFGGFGSSSEQAPSFSFSQQGVYPVTLTVTDTDGNSASARVYVEILNTNPVAEINATPTLGSPPLEVTFDASSSYDPDGHSITYNWDLGDGTFLSGPTIVHTYTDQGAYFPALTVADPHGGSATAVQKIEVGNQAPVVDYTWSIPASALPVTVSFDASATMDPEDDVLTYTWDFGDGSFGAGALTSHAYGAYGRYTVSLAVDDGQGNTVERTASINIANQLPEASFTADRTTGNAPLSVAFNAASSSDPEGQGLTYSWDFGDGNTAGGVSVSHTFLQAGNFLVTLQVEDPEGGVSQATRSVSILDSNGFRVPENPENLFPGIYYQYFGLSSRHPPNYDQLTPQIEGITYNLVIDDRPSRSRYAYRFDGYFYAPEDGEYTFTYLARDTLIMSFGDSVLINEPSITSQDNTGAETIRLLQGYHRIEILHHMGNIDSWTWLPQLRISVGGPGFASRAITDGDLWWQFGRVTSQFIVSPSPQDNIVSETVNFIPKESAGTRIFYIPKDEQNVQLNFNGGPSLDPDSDIVTYQWDFGNGSTASGRTVSQSFGSGTYVVTLKVGSADGGLAESGQTIIVRRAPQELNRAREFGKGVAASDEAASSNGFAENAFDGDRGANSRWLLFGTEGWIELHFNDGGYRQAYVIDQYAITNPNDWNDRDPSSIIFEASNDGINWETLDVQTDLVWPSPEYRWIFDIDNTTAYSSYRWEIVPTAESPQGWIVEVQEIEIFDNGTGDQPVNQAPVASFTPPVSAEVLEPITFDASASYDPDRYPLMFFWDFGDGQTQRTFEPITEHIYYNPGTYETTLTIRDSLGGMDTASSVIQVAESSNNSPIAQIELSMEGNVASLDASGSSDPDGDPISYLWDFGDGFASTQANPSHTYGPGLFSASVTIRDNRGGVATAAVTVDNRLAEQPESVGVNFTTYVEAYLLNPYEYAGALQAQFWNNDHQFSGFALVNSMGEPTSLIFDRGSAGIRRTNATSPVGGANGALVNSSIGSNSGSFSIIIADIPYDEFDLYLYTAGWIGKGSSRSLYMEVDGVRKYLRDDDGVWDYSLDESTASSAGAAVDGREYVVFRGLTGTSKTVNVNGIQDGGLAGFQVVDRTIPNDQPIAQLSADPLTGDAPLVVDFDASGSSDPDGSITLYQWDFDGDGFWDATGSQAQHTYTQIGSYTATLRVTDNRSATDEAQVSITVAGNSPPQAAFSALPESGRAPLSVTFDGSASVDSDGSIALYEWDFNGNGLANDTGVTAEYIFPAGTHLVTLTVTDNQGGTGSTSKVITSLPNQRPTIEITSPGNGVGYRPPADIVFTVDAQDADGSIAQVSFFDGSTYLGESTSSPFSFEWSSVPEGTYTIRALASDNDGGTTYSEPVTIIVTDSNTAPVVDAGPAQSVSFPASAQPDATVTDDGFPNGGVLNYAWAQVSGPGTATFSATDVLSPEVNFDQIGTYVLELTADDGELSASDTVTIQINEPEVLAYWSLNVTILSNAREAGAFNTYAPDEDSQQATAGLDVTNANQLYVGTSYGNTVNALPGYGAGSGFRLRDRSEGYNITISNLDLTEWSALILSYGLNAASTDGYADTIQYSLDSGATWQTAIPETTYVTSGWQRVTNDLSSLDVIEGQSNVSIRIRISAVGNNQSVEMDNIQLTGSSAQSSGYSENVFDEWYAAAPEGLAIDTNKKGFEETANGSLANGVIFALGINSLDPADAAGKIPTAHLYTEGGKTYLEMRLRRRTGGSGDIVEPSGYFADGVRYVVEHAESMLQSDWSASGAIVEEFGTIVDNEDGTETVRVRIVQPANLNPETDRGFLRLRVIDE